MKNRGNLSRFQFTKLLVDRLNQLGLPGYLLYIAWGMLMFGTFAMVGGVITLLLLISFPLAHALTFLWIPYFLAYIISIFCTVLGIKYLFRRYISKFTKNPTIIKASYKVVSDDSKYT